LDMIIDKALSIEEESYNLYNSALSKFESKEAKLFLKELADWELEHKAKLIAIKNNPEEMKKFIHNMPKIEDLKIIDRLEGKSLIETSYYEYQKFLTYAGKREKETFEFYDELAKRLGNTKAGKLFARLAAEELSHKNKIEKEYDQYILHED
jgi:rubrerythrin